MSMQKSFSQQRIEELINWATGEAAIPGMNQATYVGIFDYVLREQENTGYWTIQGQNWKVVMTAVVLKALAALRFRVNDHWPTKDEAEGSVQLAIDFLTNEVISNKGKPAAVGEDIWDACQAALALGQFGKSSEVLPMVGYINDDWKNLYRSACNTAVHNRWCGPAYLAAMVDVLGRYEKELGSTSHFADALNALKDLERKDQQGHTIGFQAIVPRDDMNLWTTSLVLRTLSTVPENNSSLVNREQIQRITEWVLAQLQATAWQTEYGEAPMFLARCLHSLQVARPWTDSRTRERIDVTTTEKNSILAGYFHEKPERRGNLKAYTAVVEYLADWRIPVSAGLVFQAGVGLRSSAIASSEPQPREGGLRIAWLSDLHVAAEDTRVPSTFSMLERYAGRFMRFEGTRLTQHFQLRNLSTILNHLQTLKPDHILVTGDVTNYAQQSQFRSVHDQFLSLQARLGRGDGALSPELWTILPGNHDVTDEQSTKDSVRPKLGMFFQWFRTVYNLDPLSPNFSTAFPLIRKLRATNGALSVRLVALDTTVDAPVWWVGVNARGRIDKTQMDKLTRELGTKQPAGLTLIAMHHHPIVIPKLNSELEDYFLSLDENSGRGFIKLCVNTNVSAILHGHFHYYSHWSGLTPHGAHMAIIGSPAGTVNIPGINEEFFELREAERETTLGVEEGLAMYSHTHRSGGTWDVRFTGIFLPCYSESTKAAAI